MDITAARPDLRLPLGLNDQIERRRQCPAHRAKPGRLQDALELARAGLGAEDVRAVLRDGVGAAHGRRGGIVEAADRIDVVLDAVAGERLDQHERAVLGHGARRVPHRIDRPAHVVQAVEEADEVVVALGIGRRPSRPRR